MRLIMDYVPNHSSKEHQWFEKSRKSEATYKDYYVWRNCISEGINTVPPNNWVCFIKTLFRVGIVFLSIHENDALAFLFHLFVDFFL